jgi:hypothetical protein
MFFKVLCVLNRKKEKKNRKNHFACQPLGFQLTANSRHKVLGHCFLSLRHFAEKPSGFGLIAREILLLPRKRERKRDACKPLK